MAKHEVSMEPLGMKCTDTDCEHGLHYFKPTKRHPLGTCRKCDAAPVDWERLHKKDIRDIAYTFKALQNERIRHKMWDAEVDSEALRRVQGIGVDELRAAAAKRMRSRNFSGIPHPVYDGRQTPMAGDIIYYAQHSTATCCRKCISYWYGIPLDRELTEEEVVYLTELIVAYCQKRLPSLVSGKGCSDKSR